MFYDKVLIYAKAGDGGGGIVSFRRERFIAKGGPDGGDGGNGGNIIFKVDFNLNTLSYFNRNKHLIATSGKNGGKKKMHGASGNDLIVYVPSGTTIYNDKTNELLADLTCEDEDFVVASGGKGGFGNAHFATSTKQAPTFAEKGEPGEEKWLRLELKLVADVGIIGLPNSGKSTLLSVISSAKPKIANYPFTTLIPNLGVVNLDDFSFVACDIPGLIEGAYKGKGLGDEFLRHVERCRILVHLIDIESQDIMADFETINNELKMYSKELTKKPQIVVINKMDTLGTSDPTSLKLRGAGKRQVTRKIDKLFKIQDSKFKVQGPLFVSAVTGQGVKELLYKIAEELKNLPKKKANKKIIPVFKPHEELLESFSVTKEGNLFIVSGKKIERIASKIDIENFESKAKFFKIAEKAGLLKELEKQGIKIGQQYKIGRILLKWE